jgi:ribose 5-phosphate isomerase B
MRLAIAADHAGFVLKERLRRRLEQDGHEVLDFGATSDQSCDYPDFAQAVGREVAQGRSDRGLLVCSTGVGMAIAANKVAGIRAAQAESDEEVRLTREHNDANILTLGAKFIDEERAMELIRIFLDTEFQGGRHSRRIAKIALLESRIGLPACPTPKLEGAQ